MSTSNKLRTMIIDDEPLARTRVREKLQGDDEIEIIAECGDGREAIAAINTETPDLIFLDVQMPELDGFAVLQALPPEKLPLVIFMTAYDQYAVRAFDVFALDYLLKPFNSDRLARAVARAKTKIRNQQHTDLSERTQALLDELGKTSRYLERLVIKKTGSIFLLKTSEIDWIEAEDNYVRLHQSNESHLLRETISNLETQLDPKRFVRIHRGTIINVDRIRELRPWFGKDFRVVLEDGTELSLSRNYREKVEQLLGRSL